VTCQEFQELAGALALGTLDAADRAAAEEHLLEREHGGCPEALARARATVAGLAGALPPVAPSDEVWRAIAARLGLEAPGAPAVMPLRRLRAVRSLPWVAAAASLAAAVVGFGLWGRERAARERGEAELAEVARGAQLEARERAALAVEVQALRSGLAREREIMALLDADGSRVVPLAPVGGGGRRATAIVNPRLRRAVIVSTALAPEPGKDWQLWVIHGAGAPEPAGFLRFVPGAALAMGEIDPRLLATPPGALAVSREPAGGSPSPTEVVLLGKLAG
jgi:anti-sigma-K factor RskA